MSTIALAAQRSYTLNEAVWFSYRLPSLKKGFCTLTMMLVGFIVMATVGLYAHIYWNLRHPAPEPEKVTVSIPETQLSDMHYVYVSKPFPQPATHSETIQREMPPLQDLPVNANDADWQQAPDGKISQDNSRDTLPGTQVQTHKEEPQNDAEQINDDGSVKELLMQALKEQQQDISKGKEPAPPVDETKANVQANAQEIMIHQNIPKSIFSKKPSPPE